MIGDRLLDAFDRDRAIVVLQEAAVAVEDLVGGIPGQAFEALVDVDQDGLVAFLLGDYDTVGGLFMSQLGRVPTVGDKFEWKELRFEVMDMDGHRVDKVLVIPLKPAR